MLEVARSYVESHSSDGGGAGGTAAEEATSSPLIQDSS